MSVEPQQDLLADPLAKARKSSNASSSSRSGKAKLFQCTGHGDCRMVFTRSEHLARHMRKHTGEKPFKCVVPGCNRMFSRFDNMMQHTQTHSKSRGGTMRRTKSTNKKKQSRKKDSDSSESPTDYDFDDYPSLPSPPPSRRTSAAYGHGRRHQQQLYPDQFVDEDDEDARDDMEESDSDASYHPPHDDGSGGFYHPSDPRQSWYHREPPSPADSSSSSSESEQRKRRRMTPKVHFHPYPYNHKHQPYEHNVLRPIAQPSPDHMVLPRLASYLVNHPDEPPENYILHCHRSMSMPDIKAQPPQPMITRRLSVQDLCNPIECLDRHEDDASKDGVDLTQDEYEAIQGFGRFRLMTSVNKHSIKHAAK